MNKNESLKSILELRSIIEKVYFKEFVGSLEFPIELNQTHVKTMMILMFEGESSMSIISNKVNLEKGSFTPVADKLIKLGFIIKSSDLKDKRVFNLHLTDKGRDFTIKFSESHNVYVEKLLERLSEHEKDLYFSAIQLINDITKKISSDKIHS